MADNSRNEPLGVGCISLFAIPFLLSGIFLSTRAVTELRSAFGEKAILLLITALCFIGVGVGLVGFGIVGARKAKILGRLRALYPQEPWKWREDWAKGISRSHLKSSVMTSFAVGAFTLAVSAPLLFAFSREWSKGNHLIFIGLIFPMVGVGFFTKAIREYLRLRKYGEVYMTLETLPGILGGGLKGWIHLPPELEPRSEVVVKLQAIRHERRGSGKNRSTWSFPVYEDETETLPVRGAQGTQIRVEHAIPIGLRPTDDSIPEDRMEWRVVVTCAQPGVDFSATFPVPVFQTAASDSELTEEQLRLSKTENKSVPKFSPGITFLQSGSNLEISFSSFRTPLMGFMLILFGLLFFIFPVLFFTLSSSVVLAVGGIFGVIFSLIGILLILCGVTNLFSSSFIIASQAMLEVTWSFLGFQRKRQVPAPEISGFNLHAGMKSSDRIWYDLRAITRDDKKITLGSGIRDKDEAEWLLVRLREYFHVQ